MTTSTNTLQMTIAEFFREFIACDSGQKWALRNCKSMAEVWDTIKPEWLVWIATRRGVLDSHSNRLFACYCVRQVWNLLSDARSRQAIEVAEDFVAGLVTKATMKKAAAAVAADAADAARKGKQIIYDPKATCSRWGSTHAKI